MSDLISKSALLKHRRKVVEYDEAGFSMDYFAVPVEEIKNTPTVEAKPVVHGEWIYFPGLQPGWKCSNCHSLFGMKYKHNYCPHCGSDMRGGKND